MNYFKDVFSFFISLSFMIILITFEQASIFPGICTNYLVPQEDIIRNMTELQQYLSEKVI